MISWQVTHINYKLLQFLLNIHLLETLPFRVIGSVWFPFLPVQGLELNLRSQTVSPFWWASLTSIGNI